MNSQKANSAIDSVLFQSIPRTYQTERIQSALIETRTSTTTTTTSTTTTTTSTTSTTTTTTSTTTTTTKTTLLTPTPTPATTSLLSNTTPIESVYSLEAVDYLDNMDDDTDDDDDDDDDGRSRTNLVLCRTRIDQTEFTTRLGDFINLPCSTASSVAYLSTSSSSSRRSDLSTLASSTDTVISGFMLYECREDGNFYFINSTCMKRKLTGSSLATSPKTTSKPDEQV